MPSPQAPTMAPSSFSSTAFLNFGMDGTNKLSRWLRPVSASSSPTSAATTRAANLPACAAMRSRNSFRTSSPLPTSLARSAFFSPGTIGEQQWPGRRFTAPEPRREARHPQRSSPFGDAALFDEESAPAAQELVHVFLPASVPARSLPLRVQLSQGRGFAGGFQPPRHFFRG